MDKRSAVHQALGRRWWTALSLVHPTAVLFHAPSAASSCASGTNPIASIPPPFG